MDPTHALINLYESAAAFLADHASDNPYAVGLARANLRCALVAARLAIDNVAYTTTRAAAAVDELEDASLAC